MCYLLKVSSVQKFTNLKKVNFSSVDAEYVVTSELDEKEQEAVVRSAINQSSEGFYYNKKSHQKF